MPGSSVAAGGWPVPLTALTQRVALLNSCTLSSGWPAALLLWPTRSCQQHQPPQRADLFRAPPQLQQRAHTTSATPAATARAKGSTSAGAALRKLGLADVEHVVAVSSAKGGVGKSTTAVNLAVAMATHLGLRVGLLDADIHGPSIGKMMNLRGKPAVQQGAKQPLLLPKDNHRVRTMSMAYFMESDDAPAVWRGPMTNSAFDKMAFGTAWGPLDVLVVDLPPGTGDAQINLAQRVPLSGAVIVSTPQDVALMDAKRGTQLFRKLGVPIFGMVENMSYHVCKSCGHKEYTFGEGGVQRTADEYGLKVLAQIPLDISVRVQADAGAPIVVSHPQHACAVAYAQLASNVMEALRGLQQKGSHGPVISVE